jgi:hypothetical protein
MIGPFTNKADVEILFQLYVPRYVQTAVSSLAANTNGIRNFIDIYVENREMPLSVSRQFKDLCLIELEQEDGFNDDIPSFSFEDRDSLSPWRRNYVEAAFALGQRAKYISHNAIVPLGGMRLREYIERLQKIDPLAIYPSSPWELDENGILVVY